MALKTVAGAGLNDTALAQSSQQRHGTWSLRLPRQPDGLWDYLLDLDADSRAVLFAYCAAATVNALSQSYNRRPRALAHADRLVTLTGLDMAQAWRPTVDTYPGGSRRRRDPGRGARGQGRGLGPAHRAPQEGRHGARSRAPARPGAWPTMSHTVGPRPGRTHHPAVPGARTALNGKPATEALFACFDASLSAASYIAMSGQSVDATLVVAPRQRNTAEEKADIKAGRGPAPGTVRPAKRELASIDRRLT